MIRAFQRYLARVRLWLIDSELKASLHNELSSVQFGDPQLLAAERAYRRKLRIRRNQLEGALRS